MSLDQEPLSGGQAAPRAEVFRQLLEFEQTGDFQFVSTFGGPADPNTKPAVYGGQIAAQCLFAAGLTVDDRRRAPHSMHCYFIAGGHRAKSINFEIVRERDGGSFSSRRVTAWQDGVLLATVSASFVAPREDGWRQLTREAPPVRRPDESRPFRPGTLISFEGRDPDPPQPRMERPPRFWVRSTDEVIADSLSQAAALVYVSDVASGSPVAAVGSSSPGASLDHTVWFHGPVDLSAWTLFDLQHVVTARGRTFYDGRVYSEHGELIASLAQEELFNRQG